MEKRVVMLVVLAVSLSFTFACEDMELVKIPDRKAEKVLVPETQPIISANYYVAPSGSDLNPGTFDKPFKNIEKILSVVKPGDLVFLRGGTYYPSNISKGYGILISGKNGEPGNLIKLWAYPGEKPLIDCSKLVPVDGGVGICFKVNYWHVKGLEVINVFQGMDAATGRSTFNLGVSISNASNNIFENFVCHHNECSGLGVSGTSTNNLIINSDFYSNYDRKTIKSTGETYHGGDADGIHITVPKGTTNTIKGCRFYLNSDDGIDLWQTEGIIKIDSCWSFSNGLDQGDGNGFKLGRTLEPLEQLTKRHITHCLAYNNKQHGFDQSEANVIMEFYNNTAYNNKVIGFAIAHYNLKNTYINNLSYSNRYKDVITVESINKNNSWNGFTITDADFMTTSMAGIDGPRKSNGNLPDINFLVPTQNSSVKDKGADIGFPYKGKFPDIGVFESQF